MAFGKKKEPAGARRLTVGTGDAGDGVPTGGAQPVTTGDNTGGVNTAETDAAPEAITLDPKTEKAGG